MSVSIQKANFWKRISAWLFDAIIAVVLALGCCLVAVTVIDFDSISNDYNAHLEQYYEEYGKKHDVNFSLTQEEYNAMSEQEKAAYNEKLNLAQKDMQLALSKDKTYAALSYKLFRATLLVVAVGVLGSHLIWYFAIPLFLKNGQTLGKKMFGLAVIRTNCVKASNPVLFIRSIVGLYAMETMAPLFIILMIYFGYLGIIGTATLLLLLVLQIGVMVKTQTNSSIHDLLSDTMVVDLVSQRIFETEEERVAYIAEQERLAKTPSGVY